MTLKTCVPHAMLGNITANVAGIKAWIEEPAKIVIETYFFADPSEHDLDCVSDIETLLIADLLSPYTLDPRRLTLSLPLPRNLKDWHYLRAEALQ